MVRAVGATKPQGENPNFRLLGAELLPSPMKSCCIKIARSLGSEIHLKKSIDSSHRCEASVTTYYPRKTNQIRIFVSSVQSFCLTNEQRAVQKLRDIWAAKSTRKSLSFRLTTANLLVPHTTPVKQTKTPKRKHPPYALNVLAASNFFKSESENRCFSCFTFNIDNTK